MPEEPKCKHGVEIQMPCWDCDDNHRGYKPARRAEEDSRSSSGYAELERHVASSIAEARQTRDTAKANRHDDLENFANGWIAGLENLMCKYTAEAPHTGAISSGAEASL